MTFPSTAILSLLATVAVLGATELLSSWAAPVEEAAAFSATAPDGGAETSNRGRGPSIRGRNDRHVRRLQSGDDCTPVADASSNYTTFASFTYFGELDPSIPGLPIFLQTGYPLAYNQLVGDCDQAGATREIIGARVLEIDEESGRFLIVTSLSCNACRSTDDGLALFDVEGTSGPPENEVVCDCPAPTPDDVAGLFSRFMNSDDFVIIGVAQPFWEPACTGVGDNLEATTFNDTAVCLSAEAAKALGFSTDAPTGTPTEFPTEFPSEFPTEFPVEPPTESPTTLEPSTAAPVTPQPVEDPMDSPVEPPV
jgi:hypothetical protein